MKHSSFFIFLSLVLLIYCLVNYYLFIKGYKSVPNKPAYRYSYIFIFLLLASQFLISIVLLATDSSIKPNIVFDIGGIWFASMLYFFLIAVLFDLFNFTNNHFNIIQNFPNYRFNIFIIAVGLVIGLISVGYVNAKNPSLKKLDLVVNKKSDLTKLKIAMVSDIHFGITVGYSDIDKMIEKIEKENPDILIIAGDFADEGITQEKINKIKPLFHKLNIKYGIHLCLGNHEYISGINKNKKYIEELGINILQDSKFENNNFIIIGRDDKNSKMFNGKERKEISELMSDIDLSKPIILLDHQPYDLDIAAKHPIDLQLSGHTHHGQLFPLNLVTSSIFEKSWGYYKKDNTHFYISSGYGTWGPRVRIGNRPELMIINLFFKG